jgi:hypothetical protein
MDGASADRRVSTSARRISAMKKNEATKRSDTRVLNDLPPQNSKDIKGGGTAKPAIEVQDYGFGVSMPVTTSR